MNGRFEMQGGKNWKEMNANRFFWNSHWLEIWPNHFCPSMGLNGGSVATDSGKAPYHSLPLPHLFLLYISEVDTTRLETSHNDTVKEQPGYPVQNCPSGSYLVGSLKMNTTLEYSTRVVQEGDRRCKKSTLNDLAYLTPLRIPLMNPVTLFEGDLSAGVD